MAVQQITVIFFILQLMLWSELQMGRKLTQQEFIERLLRQNEQFANGQLNLLEDYVSKRVRIKCQCKIDGHIWFPTADSLLSGRGCPKCGRKIASNKHRLSNAEFIERINVMGKRHDSS